MLCCANSTSKQPKSWLPKCRAWHPGQGQEAKSFLACWPLSQQFVCIMEPGGCWPHLPAPVVLLLSCAEAWPRLPYRAEASACCQPRALVACLFALLCEHYKQPRELAARCRAWDIEQHGCSVYTALWSGAWVIANSICMSMCHGVLGWQHCHGNQGKRVYTWAAKSLRTDDKPQLYQPHQTPVTVSRHVQLK